MPRPCARSQYVQRTVLRYEVVKIGFARLTVCPRVTIRATCGSCRLVICILLYSTTTVESCPLSLLYSTVQYSTCTVPLTIWSLFLEGTMEQWSIYLVSPRAPPLMTQGPGGQCNDGGEGGEGDSGVPRCSVAKRAGSCQANPRQSSAGKYWKIRNPLIQRNGAITSSNRTSTSTPTSRRWRQVLLLCAS